MKNATVELLALVTLGMLLIAGNILWLWLSVLAFNWAEGYYPAIGRPDLAETPGPAFSQSDNILCVLLRLRVFLLAIPFAVLTALGSPRISLLREGLVDIMPVPILLRVLTIFVQGVIYLRWAHTDSYPELTLNVMDSRTAWCCVYGPTEPAFCANAVACPSPTDSGGLRLPMAFLADVFMNIAFCLVEYLLITRLRKYPVEDVDEGEEDEYRRKKN